jgi:FlaA1/EpsC-like NDP-sugar epimerase
MKQRILIVGAGVAGIALSKNYPSNLIIGFLDDGVPKNGINILGKLEDVNQIIKKYKITDVFFAIPSASGLVIRKFINSIEDQTVKLSILPRSIKTIVKRSVNINELTDVDFLNLIGREPVKHDVLEIKNFIKGKKVLVTGAAGSIGSRLVKLIAQNLNPALVICVDWWENGIFFLEQDLKNINNVVYKIADIKNEKKLDQIFTEFKPDIVFNAAAYKHVPLMQSNPVEAFNNNVWGSLNLMQMAIKHECQNFVYVSTDKAVNPVSVMGTTKRIGEMLLESLGIKESKTKLTAVRFGNVIQSNGSVLEIFKRQIDKGEPLTVTHKDVTRYFMTIEEASQLIIQSALLGKSGEIFLLDMGEPIKILDLAKSIIKLSNQPIKIKIIGLRPGEKIFEELSFNPKTMGKTENKKVYIVKNEKEYNYSEFFDTIKQMINKSLDYRFTDTEMISELNSLGFKIKK